MQIVVNRTAFPWNRASLPQNGIAAASNPSPRGACFAPSDTYPADLVKNLSAPLPLLLDKGSIARAGGGEAGIPNAACLRLNCDARPVVE